MKNTPISFGLLGAFLLCSVTAKADQLDGLSGMGLFMASVLSIIILIIVLPIISNLKKNRTLFLKIFVSILGSVSVGASTLFCYLVIDYCISRNAKHLHTDSSQWFWIILCSLLSVAVLLTGLYALATVFKVGKRKMSS